MHGLQAPLVLSQSVSLVLGSTSMLADRLKALCMHCRLILLFLPKRCLVSCFTCFWLWTTKHTGLAACSPLLGNIRKCFVSCHLTSLL